MKISLSVICVFVFFSKIVLAQEKQKDSINKHFTIPKINIPITDSLNKNLVYKPFSPIPNDISVAIPNAYYKSENIIHNMPIKVLSGKGLAPMPGTENLDKIEHKKSDGSGEKGIR